MFCFLSDGYLWVFKNVSRIKDAVLTPGLLIYFLVSVTFLRKSKCFDECLDLMTEQCRKCQIRLAYFWMSTRVLSLCSWSSPPSWWSSLSFFLSYQMKNNLFLSNNSRLNDEHCIRLISSLWLFFVPFFQKNGLLITNCCFVSLWFFCLYFSLFFQFFRILPNIVQQATAL